MDKIKILKTEEVGISFNINVFINSLLDLRPDYDTVDAWLNGEQFLDVIKREQLFNFNAKDIFIIRQLLTTGYFVIYQDPNDMKPLTKESAGFSGQISSAIKIRVDKIVPGTIYNIATNSDIVVEKITNLPYYNFHIDLKESGLKKLLKDSQKLYTLECFSREMAKPSSKTEKLTLVTSSFFNKKDNNFVNLGPLNKYFKETYFMTVSQDLDVLISQLYRTGNLEILRELMNNDEKNMKRLLAQNQIRTNSELYYFSLSQMTYTLINIFNKILNEILKSPKSYESILKKIEQYSIVTLPQLQTHLSKDEKAKVAKMIEFNPPVQNNCSHIGAFRKFFAAKNKKEFTEELSKLDEYILHDTKMHVFRCKKCNWYLYCEHTIDFFEASQFDLSIPTDVKYRVAEKYRNLDIEDPDTIFCKYCSEKLYRPQNDEIMDGATFNMISHARSIENNSTTELPVVKGESYVAIKKVIDDFIFDYDFNKISLIKNIQVVALTYILEDLATLKITFDNEHFVGYAQMLSMIYAYIYMFDIYSKDKKINMRNIDANAKLNINQYATTFAERTLKQVKGVSTDSKRVQKFIERAYFVLKNEQRSTIDVITDLDVIVYIVSNPFYQFIYNLYKLESKKEEDYFEAFRHIVKVKQPTQTNFWHDSWKPDSATWKLPGYSDLAEIYDINLNYASPYNYIHVTFENCDSPTNLFGYIKQEFKPDIMLKLYKRDDAVNERMLKSRYLNLLYKKDAKRKMTTLLPLCYIYNVDGEQYKWEPVMDTKRKVTDYVCGKTTFSSIKCSDKLNEQIAKKIFPDKRIGVSHKLPEFKKTKTEETKYKELNISFNIVKKINSSFNLNQIKFIAQSEGVTLVEFLKGNIIEQYNICAFRLRYYINIFISKYNDLRFNVNNVRNLHYFERAKLVNSIQKYLSKKFPEIDTARFQNLDTTNLKIYYENQQLFLVDSISLIYKYDDPITNLFLVDILNDLFGIDKLYCKSEGSKIGDIEVNDEDTIGNSDEKIDVNEDDEDYVNVDDIDYEQDTDEIPAD